MGVRRKGRVCVGLVERHRASVSPAPHSVPLSSQRSPRCGCPSCSRTASSASKSTRVRRSVLHALRLLSHLALVRSAASTTTTTTPLKGPSRPHPPFPHVALLDSSVCAARQHQGAGGGGGASRVGASGRVRELGESRGPEHTHVVAPSSPSRARHGPSRRADRRSDGPIYRASPRPAAGGGGLARERGRARGRPARGSPAAFLGVDDGRRARSGDGRGPSGTRSGGRWRASCAGSAERAGGRVGRARDDVGGHSAGD